MRRRDIAILLGSAAIIWPRLARPQTATKLPRVGVLHPGTPAAHARSPQFRAFYEGMRELGWVAGVTVAYELRYAEGVWERLPDLARDLASISPDVMVTASTPPALAAKAATSKIPIVILDPGDPVATGLVTSLGHPGGITGVSSMAPDLAAKRLEILREAAPAVTRIAMLFNTAVPPTEVALKEMADAAARLGIALHPLPIGGEDDFAGVFGAIERERIDGLVVFADPLTHWHQDRIVSFALGKRLPALYANRQFVNAGGLLSYGPNYPAMFRRGAYYVDRILKGAKPAELPVEQPTKFELVINLNTAKVLGLAITPSILARADEVIE